MQRFPMNPYLERKTAMSKPMRWKPMLHLMPPTGWLNDPNGLCQFHGIYHVFFQYRPEDAFGSGDTGWGHYTSPNLVHWTFEGTPLLPDQPFDSSGVYSGSALVDNGSMLLYYTGNVKQPGDYDYTYAGREANVVLVSSQDGINFGKKELLLTSGDYPDNCTCHVRDPKVWRDGDGYYMVLGARMKRDAQPGSETGHAANQAFPHPAAASSGDYGGALLYRSADCRQWDYCNTLTTPEAFGYMWECPDTFFVDGLPLLSISPQGLKRERRRFQNVYQSGYFTVTGDLTGDYVLSDFKEWDMGFDFYAPQTFCDEKGRRILIAWMGLPDISEEYQNPTTEDGWQHILTLPRELYVNSAGAVCQRPVAELESLRETRHQIQNGKSIQVDAPFDLLVCPEKENDAAGDTVITLYDSLRISYSPAQGECSMEFLSPTEENHAAAAMPSPGYGRTVRRAGIHDGLRQIRIICDTSCVEVFFGDGETVMSTRIYPDPAVPASVSVEGGAGSLWTLHGLEVR